MAMLAMGPAPVQVSTQTASAPAKGAPRARRAPRSRSPVQAPSSAGTRRRRRCRQLPRPSAPHRRPQRRDRPRGDDGADQGLRACRRHHQGGGRGRHGEARRRDQDGGLRCPRRNRPDPRGRAAGPGQGARHARRGRHARAPAPDGPARGDPAGEADARRSGEHAGAPAGPEHAAGRTDPFRQSTSQQHASAQDRLETAPIAGARPTRTSFWPRSLRRLRSARRTPSRQPPSPSPSASFRRRSRPRSALRSATARRRRIWSFAPRSSAASRSPPVRRSRRRHRPGHGREPCRSVGAHRPDPELRRSLEAQGLTVISLDVGQAGVGSQASPDRDRPAASGQARQRPCRRDDTEETTTIDVSKLPLAAGQLDVLA